MDTMDHCDRCGPGTSPRIVITTGNGELRLCGHHYRQHLDAIISARYLRRVVVGGRTY